MEMPLTVIPLILSVFLKTVVTTSAAIFETSFSYDKDIWAIGESISTP